MGAIECLAFTDATVVIVDAASCSFQTQDTITIQIQSIRQDTVTVNHDTDTDTVNQARYRYSQSRYSFQRQVLDFIVLWMRSLFHPFDFRWDKLLLKNACAGLNATVHSVQN